MAEFKIEYVQSLGITHDGCEVTVEGESSVELTDEEVKVLVDLICEKGTADVKKLKLKKNHPALYKKLDKAYHDMAYKAEENHWLWEGYHNHYYEYDDDELMDYCKRECGFTFEFKPEDYPEYSSSFYEIPEVYERLVSDIEWRSFSNWLYEYIRRLSDDEFRDFLCNHMNADVEIDEVNYEVCIPQAIIDMAKNPS